MLVLWRDKPKPVKNTCLRYSRLTVTYQAEIFSSVKKHFTGRQYLALFLDPPFFLFFLIISHQNMECGYADVHGIMYLKVNEEIANCEAKPFRAHQFSSHTSALTCSRLFLRHLLRLYFVFLLKGARCFTQTCPSQVMLLYGNLLTRRLFFFHCRCDPILVFLFCTVAPRESTCYATPHYCCGPVLFLFHTITMSFFISLCLSLHSCLRRVSL